MKTHPSWSVCSAWENQNPSFAGWTPAYFRNYCSRRSNGEAVTALGAARSDDLATALGAHANEETMGALAANDGGLVGAFHDLCP